MYAFFVCLSALTFFVFPAFKLKFHLDAWKVRQQVCWKALSLVLLSLGFLKHWCKNVGCDALDITNRHLYARICLLSRSIHTVVAPSVHHFAKWSWVCAGVGQGGGVMLSQIINMYISIPCSSLFIISNHLSIHVYHSFHDGITFHPLDLWCLTLSGLFQIL